MSEPEEMRVDEIGTLFVLMNVVTIAVNDD